jgi:hypothetical protein
MSSLPNRNVQGSAESLPHNICPQKQLIELECIMLWERKYAILLAKARQARDFHAFSSSSSAKPPQHYLSRASKVSLPASLHVFFLTMILSQYRSEIGM